MKLRMALLSASLLLSVSVLALTAQRGAPPDLEKDPFKGVTTSGAAAPGLFPIRATGVSTAPAMHAALQFLAALTTEQRRTTLFPVDDSEWRRWNNVHRAARAGLAFKDMNAEQQTRGFDLLRASLSAKGLEKTRNVMKLNHSIAELTNNFTEYGEGLYNLVVLGEPSPEQPWGWQLEGHHLIVNYFVLRDQVVMTPTFMGSEPVVAESGKYAGTKVLQEEQDKGLALMRALTAGQQQKALIEPGKKTANKAQAQAYRDNLVLPYAGVKGSELNATQRTLLTNVIREYVDNMPEGQAKVRMDEVRAHLDETYFGWIGDIAPGAVFYYRIHSPVILIEFDHQSPVALEGSREPSRRHVHTVVRTPNGNDYGKDLLRQHYEKHAHDPAHGHTHRPR
jgi:hypothetical protein